MVPQFFMNIPNKKFKRENCIDIIYMCLVKGGTTTLQKSAPQLRAVTRLHTGGLALHPNVAKGHNGKDNERRRDK
jgi:hypothetical protein